MPTIAYFYGIYIRMYLKDHPPAHFHAIYGDYEAIFDIRTGEILKGKLPRSAARLVSEWTDLNRASLMENWHCVQSGAPLKTIPGLDDEQSS